MPGRFMPRRVPVMHDGWGPGVLGTIVMIAFLATLVVLTVWLITNMRKPQGLVNIPSAPPTPPLPPAGPDPALSQARMRYARGEIGQEEFLRIASDLGEPPSNASA